MLFLGCGETGHISRDCPQSADANGVVNGEAAPVAGLPSDPVAATIVPAQAVA